ncbi:MAG: TolC family protein [Calditrichaeota bacterium]|nr:TolC family protein [Calditrichota bacterium]
MKLTFVSGLIIFLIFTPAFSPAQQSRSSYRFTLESCIHFARDGSPAAAIEEAGFQRRYWDYRAFRADLLPRVVLNGNAPGLNRSITAIVLDGGNRAFIPQSDAFSSATLSLVQTLPWTGGQLTLSSGLQRIDQFGGGQDTLFWQSTPLVFSFLQPLFRHNDSKWRRLRANLDYRIAEREYRESLEGIAVDITDTFFDFYIAQMNVANAEFNVAINDTLYTISQGRYQVGTIAENELLQIELALLTARNELAGARLALQRALASLKTTLGLPGEAQVEVIPPAWSAPLSISPDTAIAYARRNRSNFLTYDARRLSAREDISRARSEAGFSASLSASFGFNQSADNIPGVYRDPLDQQFFTVNFQMPILDWGRSRAVVQAARLEQERLQTDLDLQEENFVQEVRFLAEEFLLLQEQVILAAKADTIANRRYEVTKNRYLVGKIDITELYNAQSQKDGARQNYIQTLRRYWVTYYRLRQQTLYDFREGVSIL